MGLSYGDYLAIKNLLLEMETRMTAREDASYEALNADIETVKTGWAALQAENANLREQLVAAGQDFQAKLDEDSNADADKVDAADAALKSLTVPNAEPTA